MNNNFIPADAAALASRIPESYTALVVQTTGSTNNDILDMQRRGETSHTVLVAHTQVSGKGRLGRSFSSAPGGIYFSFNISLPASDERARLRLTPLAGLAAAETLHSLYALDVRIKWVNDLILGGKKLCGILAESVIIGDTLHAVVGIGINACNTDFPDTATSISRHTDATIDANDVIGGTVTRFISRLPNISDDSVIDEYKSLSTVIGHEVTVHAFDGSPDYTATAVDIDRDCSLIIRADGELRRLSSGEVSVRAVT